MALKALFLAHEPDADKEKHRCFIETSKYQIFVVIAKNQKEAVEVSMSYLREKNIDSIMLCPGFTQAEVAEISGAGEDRVAISVARGDGPSNKMSLEARKREGYF